MRKLLFSLMVSLYGFTASGQTQGQMNNDAEESFKVADKELNEVYSKIVTEYKDDTLFIKNLKTSQRLRVQFRDAEMAMKYPAYEAGHFGSVLPMCWSLYKQQLTRNRIKTLRQWLDGSEEGDVCAGSVKRKRLAH